VGKSVTGGRGELIGVEEKKEEADAKLKNEKEKLLHLHYSHPSCWGRMMCRGDGAW
jgi:hypothetical protein